MTAVASQRHVRHVRAASLAELRAAGRLVVRLDRHTLCLFADGEKVYAVDNRCPHMGFPLYRGTVCDGILTCHWHHARFDLATGGTFERRQLPRRVGARRGCARAWHRHGPDHDRKLNDAG